jgi:hypothetical protein
MKANEKLKREDKKPAEGNWMQEINEFGEREGSGLVEMPEKKTYEEIVENMGGGENEEKPFWT